MNISRDNIRGVSFLVLALLIFSLQNIAVKWIGGDYSVLEIVMLRSFVALPAALVLYRLEGNRRGLPTTQHHKLEYSFSFRIPPTSWAWQRCNWLMSNQSAFPDR